MRVGYWVQANLDYSEISSVKNITKYIIFLSRGMLVTVVMTRGFVAN